MKKPVIICVDDEKIVLDSLKKELAVAFKEMLVLEIAESGEEAIELIKDLINDGTEIPIIVSDWLMPQMKGDEFLIEAHRLLPNAKKILLTGQATSEGVGNAVNKAKLYRYIAKPWDSIDFNLTVSEAFKIYYKEKKIESQQQSLEKLNANLELNLKEKSKEIENANLEMQELLDKTLKGSINILLGIISKTNPILFEKSIRMKTLCSDIAKNMRLEGIWEFEIAALLSQIGCIDFDKEIVEKYYLGKSLNQNELSFFKMHPEKAYAMLKNIPHFANISEGILNMFVESVYSENKFALAHRSFQISKILCIANDYDQAKLQKVEDEEIISIFRKRKNLYDSELVFALKEIVDNEKQNKNEKKVISISITDLKIGMIVAEAVVNNEGRVVINKNEEISQAILMNLVQIKKKSGIVEPIYVFL